MKSLFAAVCATFLTLSAWSQVLKLQEIEPRYEIEKTFSQLYRVEFSKEQNTDRIRNQAVVEALVSELNMAWGEYESVENAIRNIPSLQEDVKKLRATFPHDEFVVLSFSAPIPICAGCDPDYRGQVGFYNMTQQIVLLYAETYTEGYD